MRLVLNCIFFFRDSFVYKIFWLFIKVKFIIVYVYLVVNICVNRRKKNVCNDRIVYIYVC